MELISTLALSLVLGIAVSLMFLCYYQGKQLRSLRITLRSVDLERERVSTLLSSSKQDTDSGIRLPITIQDHELWLKWWKAFGRGKCQSRLEFNETQLNNARTIVFSMTEPNFWG